MRILLGVLLLATACSSDKTSSTGTTTGGSTGSTTGSTTGGTTSGSTDTGVTISGYVNAPPLDANMPLANIAVSIIDPAKANKVLASITLDTNSSSCSAVSCPFTISNVDLSGLQYGLEVMTTDTRTSGADWVPVVTDAASQDAVTAAIQSHTLTDADAFVLNNGALGLLSEATSISTTDLLNNGALLALVIGTASQATAANGYFPPSVADVTASIPSNASIFYPNESFTGSGSATGPSGTFVAVATTPGTVVYGNFSLTPGSGSSDAHYTWPTYTLGVPAGYISVVIFEASSVSN